MNGVERDAAERSCCHSPIRSQPASASVSRSISRGSDRFSMTTPNSPLSPSSHSSFDEDDEAPFDPKAASHPPAASAPPSTPASPHMPPLQKADEQSSASSLSSSRRHSLSSSSSTSTASLASPHLPAHAHFADTSLSSASSTPSSTPSSAASNPTSPFVHSHSLAQLTAAAAATDQHNGKQLVKAEAGESQQQQATSTQQPQQPTTATAASSGGGSPPVPVAAGAGGGTMSTSSGGGSGGLSMSQLASEAAVLANSHTLAKAMIAAAGHSALVQQQQQQQQQKALTSLSAYPTNSALTTLSNTLSSLQYANRAPLPAPLASLPPLALSFSSHTSATALTPSAAAAAAAAGTSGLSSFASSLHSSLLKNAANAGIMSQLLHANTHSAVVNGLTGVSSSAPHSPLPAASAATNLTQANGINSWSLTLPAAANTPTSPQPYSTPPQSASPASTPPVFPASSSSSSLASLSALALPSAEGGGLPTNGTLPPPSPFSSAAPASPTAPMLAAINTAASSTLSPYAYSPSPNTSSALSALTQPSTFTRLPSLPLSLPSPTLQSLYPAHLSHLLPAVSTPFVSSSNAALSSASFAAAGGSSSHSASLSSVGGLSAVSWPAASSVSSSPQLNRYLIHFPADTAHGAQSGLYQPGKPSQLIIHMAEADAPAVPQPSPAAAAGVSGSEADVLPAGHSLIRIPVKVAIKPTVKRTAKLRTLHEVSVHPAWYDCESRDLSEEEKKWETGSKAKKPKYLLLRHDTKSCIHVLQVNRWTADEHNTATGGPDEQMTASTPRDSGTVASPAMPASSSTSTALSGLLNSLTAAGGSLPFVPPSAPCSASSSSSSSSSFLPLHILPVSDDSMAHVQTKGRGKTEDRRKETAQLYLSLKVDKWYELRCHSGWRIVEMEMKHHKGGHQISSVLIPFHYLPGDLTVGEGVQAITLLATGSQPHSMNASSSPAAVHASTGQEGKRQQR